MIEIFRYNSRQVRSVMTSELRTNLDYLVAIRGQSRRGIVRPSADRRLVTSGQSWLATFPRHCPRRSRRRTASPPARPPRCRWRAVAADAWAPGWDWGRWRRSESERRAVVRSSCSTTTGRTVASCACNFWTNIFRPSSTRGDYSLEKNHSQTLLLLPRQHRHPY